MVDLLLLRAKRILTGKYNVLAFELPTSSILQARDMVREGIEKWQDCYDIKVGLPKKPRTTGDHSQSHHFNGHVQQIALSSGNDFADVKLYVKRRAFKLGLPFLTRHNGDVVRSLIDGEPLPISESDMTTIQCGWCIDCAHEVAAEFGIVLVEV